MKTRLLVLLAGTFVIFSVVRCFAGSTPFYEAHCKELLPVFTLGENSKPTKDQESVLCACIWNDLDEADRVTSEKIHQGKEAQISAPEKQVFITHFGEVVDKCGGMKL